MLITSIVFRVLPLLMAFARQDLILKEPHVKEQEGYFDNYVEQQKSQQVEISYFPVYGETPSGVRKYLSENGFVGRDNVRYDAYTEWQ
ncbi:MAG: DUF922 domain-containing Zn-dependent protease, partial [SAR324 cluster bacterium]|nr:DUF922 domain-containing Zn-dependent protease [SAR324 cluster bacterium]